MTLEEQLRMMTDSEREQAFGPLLKLWGTQGRNADIERQLMQAQALSNRPQKQYTNAGAAALGGIGDVFGGLMGGLQQNKLQGQLSQNRAQMEDPKFFNNPITRQLLLSQMLQKPGVAQATGGAGAVPGSAGMGDLDWLSMMGVG